MAGIGSATRKVAPWRPAVRGRDGAQLSRGLRQRDIQARFAEPSPFEEELERERRLAGAWFAFDQVQSVGRKTSAQKLIETGNAGESTCIGIGGIRVGHRSSGAARRVAARV
jgi:hypothetical protein